MKTYLTREERNLSTRVKIRRQILKIEKEINVLEQTLLDKKKSKRVLNKDLLDLRELSHPEL